MLKTQWKNEENAEMRMTQQKFHLDRQRNADIIKQNEEERLLREMAALQQKARDKDMLTAGLAREAAIKQIEQDEQQARRNETIALQDYYHQQKEDKVAYEKMIEELTLVENDKIRSKQEAQWRRED